MAYPEYRAAYGDEGKIMHSGAQWLWVSAPEPVFCSATGCQATRPSTGHFCPEHEEWDWTFDHSEYGETSEPIPMEMFNTRPGTIDPFFLQSGVRPYAFKYNFNFENLH